MKTVANGLQFPADAITQTGLSSLEDCEANLVFADPPYNIGIDYGKGAIGLHRRATRLLLDFARKLGCETSEVPRILEEPDEISDETFLAIVGLAEVQGALERASPTIGNRGGIGSRLDGEFLSSLAEKLSRHIDILKVAVGFPDEIPWLCCGTYTEAT